MFQEQNYQAGGIVGYNGRGSEGQLVYEDELTPYANRTPQESRPDFATSVRQAQALMAPHLQKTQEEKDLTSILRAPPADENKMMWMSLLRGGLKALGGSSPYANVNLGQGLGEAAQSYEEGLKEQQKQKLAYAKEMADQARTQRQEGLAALTLGQKIYSDEATLQASLARAAKEGDMNSYARTYATALKEKGDTRSDTQLLQEGAQEYVKLRGGLEARIIAANAATAGAGAQVKQADVAGKRQKSDEEIRRDELERKKADENDKNRRDAAKNVNTMLSDPDTELRKRIRKEGRDKVREDLMKQELGLYGLAPPGKTPPPSGFQPKGSGQLPPNFQIIK
jgi:hypothetical protein